MQMSGDECGFCHRMPPVFLNNEEEDKHSGCLNELNWSFPVTAIGLWCGEWQPKRATKELKPE